MASFTLDISSAAGATAVSNLFIDTYMPKASGSFVKVYLCLLRHVQFPGTAVTLSLVADVLEESEKDIVRALNYWEKEGLMLLNRDDGGNITGARFLAPERREKAEEDLARPDSAALPSAVSPLPDFDADIAAAEDDVPPVGRPEQFEKPDYTEAQIEQMKENEEVKWMLTVIEVYLERLLKPADVQLILYLYESLGFSAELILYLYEYCVSRNKKSPSYVEAVALSWAEEGIDTVEKAEAASAVYTSGFQTVNKAFGLNRAPGSSERQYIQKWFGAMQFESRIVEEACSRALLQTGKPDFKYADRILENWKKDGVSSLADVAASDERHAKETAARKAAGPQKDSQPRPSSNKFNAYPQRSYSGEEFASMEQRLLAQHLRPGNEDTGGNGR